MELKDKQKVVKVIGAAEAALDMLEKGVHAFEAQGKTPPKEDAQLLKSIPNLFRIELSRFWRLLYYVTGSKLTHSPQAAEYQQK